MNSRKKILLIDDVPENIYMLKEKLEQEGFDVRATYDGKSGIQKALIESPDLILCDVMMPQMSGYEVMGALKSNPGTATIPFIFLSSTSDITDIREGMRLGADDFITKPFDSTELLEAINVRLNKKELYEKDINNLRNSISHSLPHELQTPLAAIMGFTDYLIDGYTTIEREEILDIANNIKESANRLNSLVQNILTATKLEALAKDKAGIRELRRHSITISNEFVYQIAVNKAKAYGREDDIEIDITEAQLVISKDHLKKVVEEIVDNALKFSNKNTHIHISGFSYGMEYMLYFLDHGRGMTEEQIVQVGQYMQFERMLFERKGAGLGLSIVKKILEIYCGEFTIESIPLKQTLVSARLLVS